MKGNLLISILNFCDAITTKLITQNHGVQTKKVSFFINLPLNHEVAH